MPNKRRNTQDDAELEIIRRAITPETSRSVKQTVLSCFLLRAVRRRKVASSTVVAGMLACVKYWHAISTVIGHLVRLTLRTRRP